MLKMIDWIPNCLLLKAYLATFYNLNYTISTLWCPMIAGFNKEGVNIWLNVREFGDYSISYINFFV